MDDPAGVTAGSAPAGARMAVLTLLLGGFSAFGPLSMDLYLPAFPALARDLHATTADVQLTLTADVIGLVIGQLIAGPLSDAWGRRKLLIAVTVACALTSVLCALAPSALVLTGWRFFQGATGGAGIAISRAMAADLTRGLAAARLFSLFMTVSSIAPIIAPVIGGAVLAWTGDWRPMFWLLAGTSVVLAAGAWWSLPETLPPERRHSGGIRQTAASFAALARDRVFAGYALTVAFAYASLFGYISGSAFALQDQYGLSATQFSLMFAANASGMVVLGLLNARLVRRYPVRQLLLAGLLLSAVAALLLVVVVTEEWLGLTAVLVTLFVVVTTRGLVSANATVLGAGRASHAAGAASAVLGACMFLGGIVVSPLMGLGGDRPATPMAIVVAGGAIAALLATAIMTREASRSPADGRAGGTGT